MYLKKYIQYILFCHLNLLEVDTHLHGISLEKYHFTALHTTKNLWSFSSSWRKQEMKMWQYCKVLRLFSVNVYNVFDRYLYFSVAGFNRSWFSAVFWKITNICWHSAEHSNILLNIWSGIICLDIPWYTWPFYSSLYFTICLITVTSILRISDWITTPREHLLTEHHRERTELHHHWVSLMTEWLCV